MGSHLGRCFPELQENVFAEPREGSADVPALLKEGTPGVCPLVLGLTPQLLTWCALYTLLLCFSALLAGVLELSLPACL